MRPPPSSPPPPPPFPPHHLPRPPHHPLPPPLVIPYPLAISGVENARFRIFEKKTRYGLTDGQTNGRTDPLIEMRGRI